MLEGERVRLRMTWEEFERSRRAGGRRNGAKGRARGVQALVSFSRETLFMVICSSRFATWLWGLFGFRSYRR